MILEYEVAVYDVENNFISSNQMKLHGFISIGSIIPGPGHLVREVFRIEHNETATKLFVRDE